GHGDDIVPMADVVAAFGATARIVPWPEKSP
ncbi:MAG: hypothetical protein RL291_13, partial [Pseudomonadota bacterium]